MFLNLASNDYMHLIKYTYCGINYNKSLIYHFIISENIYTLISDYFIVDCIDNLSDHVPVYLYINVPYLIVLLLQMLISLRELNIDGG